MCDRQWFLPPLPLRLPTSLKNSAPTPPLPRKGDSLTNNMVCLKFSKILFSEGKKIMGKRNNMEQRLCFRSSEGHPGTQRGKKATLLTREGANNIKHKSQTTQSPTPPLEGVACHCFFWSGAVFSPLVLGWSGSLPLVGVATVPISFRVVRFVSCVWCQICFFE